MISSLKTISMNTEKTGRRLVHDNDNSVAENYLSRVKRPKQIDIMIKNHLIPSDPLSANSINSGLGIPHKHGIDNEFPSFFSFVSPFKSNASENEISSNSNVKSVPPNNSRVLNIKDEEEVCNCNNILLVDDENFNIITLETQ